VGFFLSLFAVTPLDVVKIRLQAQQQPLKQGKCFIYHNGLMDCLCLCSRCNSGSPMQATVKTDPWYYRPSKFSGTLVCETFDDGYINPAIYALITFRVKLWLVDSMLFIDVVPINTWFMLQSPSCIYT